MRHFAGNRFEVFSAGLEPTEVHPFSIQVMNEVGIDITKQSAKSLKLYLGKKAFQYVFSVCELTSKECPRLFPGALNFLQWSFEDPDSGKEENKLFKFRQIRDQIQKKIESWLKTVQE